MLGEDESIQCDIQFLPQKQSTFVPKLDLLKLKTPDLLATLGNRGDIQSMT